MLLLIYKILFLIIKIIVKIYAICIGKKLRYRMLS